LITIKLLSTQIATYWELIKYAALRSMQIEDRYLQGGLIWLLHELLSDKAQCWFRIDDQRNVIAVVLTQMQIDKSINTKSLHVLALFSYRYVPIEEWQRGFDLLKEFGRKEQCNNIIFSTNNPKMMEIDKALGCEQTYTSFVYDLE